MRREIKFKNWNEKLKFMTEPYTLVEANIYLQGSGDNPLGVVPLQYTGLKDKNGKEIFEEDIVKVAWKETMFRGTQFEIERTNFSLGIVEYNEDTCSFYFNSYGERCSEPSELTKGMDIKVMGNVHENYDLL